MRCAAHCAQIVGARRISREARICGPYEVHECVRKADASSIRPPSRHISKDHPGRTGERIIRQRRGNCAREREARMALSLRDVRCDPIASRALAELMHDYTVAEEESRLVLTKKSGTLQLFLQALDDLHQWDFIQHREMLNEREGLRARSVTLEQQRESWKVRALMAEAQLLEATAKAGGEIRPRNVSDVRYASLKRFLAKRFHPDYAGAQGIEKIVRNEIFKEIWGEVERLDQAGQASRAAPARSSAAA